VKSGDKAKIAEATTTYLAESGKIGSETEKKQQTSALISAITNAVTAGLIDDEVAKANLSALVEHSVSAKTGGAKTTVDKSAAVAEAKAALASGIGKNGQPLTPAGIAYAKKIIASGGI
jgi:hypothetical protein